jgi:TonB family protein
MEILSLEGKREPPARGLSRAEAFLVSFGVHLVLVLLFVVVPERLPEGVRAWFTGAAARPPAARTAQTVPADPERPAPPATERIPLKFAYVKVPDDTAVPANPRARLLSDKTRRARQEVPTPPEAQRFSADPHSRGDSIDRVRPDPELPAGADSPKEAPAPAARAGAASAGGGLLAAGRVVTDEPPPAAGTIVSSPDGNTSAPPEARDGAAAVPPGEQAGSERRGPPDPVPEAAGPLPQGREGGRGAEPLGGLRDSLAEWRPGEFKFIFNNPAYLRGGSHGTLSFDTQDFPWGDYARQIYVIIRNNWLARIPLAAREGIRGYACWKFTILKDGEVGDLRLRRTSSVPPFERAASDAIRASNPLPPLPEEFPASSEGVTFCFFYNLLPGETD